MYIICMHVPRVRLSEQLSRDLAEFRDLELQDSLQNNKTATGQSKIPIDYRIVPGSFPNPVVSVGVCYTLVGRCRRRLDHGMVGYCVEILLFTSFVVPLVGDSCLCETHTHIQHTQALPLGRYLSEFGDLQLQHSLRHSKTATGQSKIQFGLNRRVNSG